MNEKTQTLINVLRGYLSVEMLDDENVFNLDELKALLLGESTPPGIKALIADEIEWDEVWSVVEVEYPEADEYDPATDYLDDDELPCVVDEDDYDDFETGGYYLMDEDYFHGEDE